MQQANLLNLALWAIVLAVIVVYCAVLAVSVYRAKKAAASKPVQAPVAAKTPPTTQEVAVVHEPLEPKLNAWRRAAKAVEEARQLQDEGRLEQAQNRLKLAKSLAPDQVGYKYEQARLYLQQKKYEEASDLLIDVLSADPGMVAARQALASTLALQQRHSDALAVARWMIDLDPYSLEGHQIAATACFALNQTAQAVAHLRRVVALDRDNLNAQNQLGVAYMRLGDNFRALESFREVLKADPVNSVAHYNMAVCYARQKMPANAVDTLTQAAMAFGRSFVLAWTQSEDFDPIRDSSEFVKFQQMDKSGSPSAATNNVPAVDIEFSEPERPEQPAAE